MGTALLGRVGATVERILIAGATAKHLLLTCEARMIFAVGLAIGIVFSSARRAWVVASV
jgi:hypothetical protein